MTPLFPARGIGTALAKITQFDKVANIIGGPVTKVETSKLQTKGLPVMNFPLQLFFDIAQTTSDAVTARTAMAAYALCYACLRYRATKLAEPPIWIVDESDQGEKWLKGEHPLSTVLETPNLDMEMQELLDIVSLYLDTTGACLLVLN